MSDKGSLDGGVNFGGLHSKAPLGDSSDASRITYFGRRRLCPAAAPWLYSVIGHELQVALKATQSGEILGIWTTANGCQGACILRRQLEAQSGPSIGQDGRLHRRAELAQMLVRQSQTDTETAGLAQGIRQVGWQMQIVLELVNEGEDGVPPAFWNGSSP
ncbi:MAG: hypothetical protein ACREP9_00890, partial [Candidatus Dormibacteraceae bacterium]